MQERSTSTLPRTRIGSNVFGTYESPSAISSSGRSWMPSCARPGAHKTPRGVCLLALLLTPVVADVIPLFWVAAMLGFQKTFRARPLHNNRQTMHFQDVELATTGMSQV